VGPGYQFYDQGVELTKDGLYLLWANFATFCVALFSQSEAKGKLVGNVFL